MNPVASNVLPKTVDILKNKEFRKIFKVPPLLELPRRSFVRLEPACVATAGNGVAGDLYDSVHPRRRMTADGERQTTCKKAGGNKGVDHSVRSSAGFTWKEPSSCCGCLPSCGYLGKPFPGSSIHPATPSSSPAPCCDVPPPPAGRS